MVQELGLPISADELLAEKSKLFLDSVATDLKSMPGVVDSVKWFREQGLLLGIGTSLDRGYLGMVLDLLKVREYFQVIVTGDEITNGKPHPETYLTVAEHLGLEPGACLVLEDAKSGIQSAKAAGCYCIAITNPNAVPQDTSEADAVVGSLDEVDDTLVAKLLLDSN